MGNEISLPCENLVNGDGIEVTVDTGVDERNHLVDGHRRVLLLLEEFGQLDMLLVFVHAQYGRFSNGSLTRSPRLRVCLVEASKSEPN